MLNKKSIIKLNLICSRFSNIHPVAPKKMGDVRCIDLAWMMLLDMIHHRGQFSIYLRMAGGKVPSIYGPSADEPWM
ncbi:MAG: DinB family protein [Ignavibacteriaceae bacterium]